MCKAVHSLPNPRLLITLLMVTFGFYRYATSDQSLYLPTFQ